MAKKNQQESTSSAKTNTFNKGMIKDTSDIYIPEGVWTNAINAINTSHTGDEGNIGTEQSNKFCTTAPYTIIGIIHKVKSEWVVFSTNELDSEIGIFDESDCSYRSITNDPCLNFSIKYLITGAVKYNPDCSYSVYWQDNNNPDRTLNLDNVPYICYPKFIDVVKKYKEVTISTSEPTTTCGIEIAVAGATAPDPPGYFEYPVSLGTAYGLVTLTFDAHLVPDRFIVNFDGVDVIDTGFRGSLGFCIIPDAIPGSGTATFMKASITSVAYLRVYAPCEDTLWEATLSCPDPNAPGTPPQPTNVDSVYYQNADGEVVAVNLGYNESITVCALEGSVVNNFPEYYTVDISNTICLTQSITIEDPDACGEKICTTELDCDKLRLHPFVQQACVTVKTAIGSGQLHNGSYQAVVAYSQNGIRISDYSIPSQPQGIWDHTGVGGSIDIYVGNLDPNYEEYELTIISTINQQTVAKKIGNYDINQTKVSVDLYLDSLETIPLSLIPLKSVIYEKSKKMFSINNYLIRTSVTTQPYFNYQPFANQIKTEWVAAKYPADYYWKGGNTVGYMRDEVYSFFIRWVYKTGSRSASFHIPGRASVPSDMVVLPYTNTDVLDLTENKVYQVYDTSTRVTASGRTKDNGEIIAKGNMAYHQSTELYPNKHRDVWGDLCGDAIRHHKMPSNETIHIHEDDGESIVLLGVQFNNILHPVDSDGNPLKEIVGYEILRGSREGNRSIIAKGMFGNMIEYDIDGNPSKKGLFQNYPYNDMNVVDPFISDTVTPLKNYLSFHSPETSFVKPYLGSGVYSKFYTEELGKTTGAYALPYKHPKEKLITDTAFALSAIVGLGIAIINIVGNTHTTYEHRSVVDINGLPVTVPPMTLSGNLTIGNVTSGTGTSGSSGQMGSVQGTYRLPSREEAVVTDREATSWSILADLIQADATSAAQIGTTAGAISQTNTLATILGYLQIAAEGIYYFSQAVDQMLEIIYKVIGFRNYVLQYNSHGIYNTYQAVTNSNVPTGVNPSIVRGIKKSGLKYMSSGVQDFDALYRVNNLFRTKFVCASLENDLDNTIAIDNTKHNVDANHAFRTFNTDLASYYGALKLKYDNQYGQLNSIIELPTDSCIYESTPEVLLTSFTAPIFGGDVYINRFTEKNAYFFFNTWMIDLPDGTEFNYLNYVNGPRPQYWANFERFDMSDFSFSLSNLSINTPSDYHNLRRGTQPDIFSVKNAWMYLFMNGVRDFFVESELNMAFRDYGENDYEKFYDVYGNSFNDLQTMFRSDLIDKPVYYKYDLSLSTAKLYNNFASWGQLLPPDYDPEVYDTCYEYFPNKGVYSLQHQDGLKRDNWRNYLPLNYYTFEGVVTNIKSLNANGSVILYEDASPSQFVGIDTLKTDGGTKITIGDGGLFTNNIQSLSNAEDALEYGASISHRATLNTPYGLFFVSQKAGKVFQYGADGLGEISKAGMKNWFLQNLPSKLLESFPNYTEYDNPVGGIGVHAIYDAQYELLYITKKDYLPLNPCIGYDPSFGFYDKCNCPKTCPVGYTYNETTELCELPVDISLCPPGYTYNPVTEKCENTTVTDLCPAGYTYNGKGTPICEGEPSACNTDVVIVMDNSTSMTTLENDQMNDFVVAIVNGLSAELASDQVRIGVVKFTDCAGIITNLNSNITVVTNAVNSARFPVIDDGANTNQFEGLCKGVQVLQGVNSRPGANKRIILVTDGYVNAVCETLPTCWTSSGYDVTFPLAPGGTTYSIEANNQIILNFAAYLKNTLGYKIVIGILGDDCERERVMRLLGGGVLDPGSVCPALPTIPTINYPISSPGNGLYDYATYESDFASAVDIASDIIDELECTNDVEPAFCDPENCIIDEDEATCTCNNSIDPTACPSPGVIVNTGTEMVCRTIRVANQTDCSVLSCDEANGFVFNGVTGKCEKTVYTNPCAPGYTYNETTQQCNPPVDTPVNLCPPGYIYDITNNTCGIVSISDAIENTALSCQADIVLLKGTPAATQPLESTFVDAFINSITSELNDSTGKIRVGIQICTNTTNSNIIGPLYYGNGSYMGGTISGTANYIKSLFPTPGSNQYNYIANGLVLATKQLYTAVNARSTAKKIIVLFTQLGPTSGPNVIPAVFNGCQACVNVGSCSVSCPSGYPSGAFWSDNMCEVYDKALCLKAANPDLKIYVVNTQNTPHTGFNGNEAQLFFDIKNMGTVYALDNSNVLIRSNDFINDIRSYICTNQTTYSCPPGCTLNGTQCECSSSTPAADCDSSCTIIPVGVNAICSCGVASVPNICGTCPIDTDLDQCACLVQQDPIVTPVRYPISLEDGSYFEPISWTISYDPKNKMWLSFHDWHPSLMIPSHSHFYTIIGGEFWKHNERFDSFANYYNEDFPWEIEYDITTANQITSLRSMEYYMEAFQYYNNGKDYFHVLDENFDRAVIYNSEQISHLLKMSIKDKENPFQLLGYPIPGPNYTEILASKEENKYRFNEIYDITRDRGEFTGVSIPMFITRADGYHKIINPAYIDPYKIATEHKKFRHFGNRIILRKNVSGDKKMILKITNSKHLNSPR